MDIQSSEYEQIAQQIHSETSPVGIDAKKTHILIIHMLKEIQQRLESLESRMEKFENR